MKSIFNTNFLTCILIACSSLFITGCIADTQTKRVPVNIGFDPVIGHDTRADEAVPFPKDRTFKLWAINENNGDLHINNEEIKYNGAWSSSKKWPDAKLSIFAYHPTSLNPSFDKDKGITLNSFDCSEGNTDILLAKTQKADVAIDSLVSLSFDHILSRVEFRMQHSLSSEIEVRLKKIELKGYGSIGNYEQERWIIQNTNHSRIIYETTEEGGTLLTKDPIYFGEDFFAIPQVCTASVEVSFNIRYGDGTWIPQVEVIKALNTEWQPSTHYTYTLNLTDTKLAFTTGISNWNNREE